MIYRTISVIFLVAFLHGTIAAQDQSQSPQQPVSNMQEVLRKAQEKDKAVKVTLAKKIDNRDTFTGEVIEISDTGFVLSDKKTGQARTLTYDDVRSVKQRGMSKGTKIVLVGAIVVGTAVGLGFALACSSEGGPHC